MSHGHHSIHALAPRSKLYQGPFGRICPDLPPELPLDKKGKPLQGKELDEHLLKIAKEHMTEVKGAEPADLNTPDKIEELQNKFSGDVPAGYTYFGQFIDHDITFDPASDLMRRNDPNALVNFRTPRLDLDCVYGRGPDDQPYLYDGIKMLTGQAKDGPFADLPRNSKGRALIGDMRNDENAIVSQLQLAFLCAHNTLIDRTDTKLCDKERFESARQTLRWLYQWTLWNDFLKRITLKEVHEKALVKVEDKVCGTRWDLGLKHVYSWSKTPFMPVEFSVAAYRFGHSMVRNTYRTNVLRGFRLEDSVAIFANTGGPPSVDEDDLRGFRPIKTDNIPQWDWFFQMDSSGGPFPQMARKIDRFLANALLRLHEEPNPKDHPLNILAFRNLRRGVAFDLPSGPDAARKFCVDPVKLDPKEPRFLWYYILREAEVWSEKEGRTTLGPLGSLILCSVFAGLLKGDPCSWLNMAPCWKPGTDPLLREGEDNIDDPEWSVASIIRLSGLPVKGDDFQNPSEGGHGGAAPETKDAGGGTGHHPPGKSKGGNKKKDEWKKPGKER